MDMMRSVGTLTRADLAETINQAIASPQNRYQTGLWITHLLSRHAFQRRLDFDRNHLQFL